MNNNYKGIGAFLPFLHNKDKILDLGCGECIHSKQLKDQGYNVTSVDVRARSNFPDITPIIYDGKRLPFANNEFDVCLIIAVLHHTPSPEAVLKEAIRVSKRLIIREDIYSNVLQKWYALYLDSLLNKEFFGHPHTNKNDSEWRDSFKNLGLQLNTAAYFKSWGWLQNVDYFLEK
jgi:2-polyprenyl-3-methyl-5-hydroxy-6-metoxy-1,4-benzoquinol methylase